MKRSFCLIVASLFIFCSNPTSNGDKASLITTQNYYSYLIRYNHCPGGNCPENYTNDITTNKWTTLDLQFILNDSLKCLSVSPAKNDTLCFDTIWAEDTNHTTNIYTFENVTTYDTTGQLGFGTNTNLGSTIQWKKLDTKILAFCPVTMTSDTTYSAEINFIHPIISTGHVKIRLKVNR